MHRIIVATDGSSAANRAIDAGAVLAKCTGADLVLLTIGGSVTGAELRDLASTAGDLSETMQAAADKIFEAGAKTRPSSRRSLGNIANRLGRSRGRDHRRGAAIERPTCWLSAGAAKAGCPPFSSAASRKNWQVLRHALLWSFHNVQHLCGAGVRLVFAQRYERTCDLFTRFLSFSTRGSS